MLYEEYEKKLAKLVKVRDFFYFTRFLWIGILVLALGATGTLLGTKGMVTKTEIVGVPEGTSAKFAYGETIELSADTFLGQEIVYEWQKQGSDAWTEESPTAPGLYYVRARSQNTFGGHYYGETKQVEITPKPISVPIDAISTYGQKPGIGDPEPHLAYKDYISSWEIEYDDISKPNPKVKLASLTILNKDGADVTACYTGYIKDFEEHTMKSVPLTITTPSQEKKYDGKPLTAKDFEYDPNELVDGDHLDTDALLESLSSAATDYSGAAVKNAFDSGDVRILNAENKDVSCHYSIRANFGNLMIQKRSITLSSTNYSKTYDGKPIANFDPNDAALDQGLEVGGEGLAYGDYLKVTFLNTGKYHAGTYTNTFNYKICRMDGGDEKDVESNYNVSTAFGTLTIDKKPLTYTAENSVFLYDGEVHTPNDPSHSELAEGDVISFTPTTTILKPSEGTKTTSFDYSIENGGESRTDDYVVTAKNGTMSVEKRPIKVQFHDLNNVYNGSAFSLDDSTSKYTVTGSLIADHSLSVSGGKKITNVGSISDAPTVKILNSASQDVTAEYDLSVLPGTITVSKAPLSVVVDPVNATFGENGDNGANYSAADVHPTGLAAGDTLTPVFGAGQFHHTVGAKLSFGYKITNASNEDVTANYKTLVEGENLTKGSVAVGKRAISLTPVFSGSNTKQYDGTPLVPSSISYDNLAAGNYIESTYEFLDCPSQVTDDYVNVSIKADTIKIRSATGIDVTDDYDITFNTAPCKINKRNLNFTLSKAVEELDGTRTITKTYSGLLAGDSIDESNLQFEETAGVVSLDTSSVIIRNSSSVIVTGNYSVSSNSVGLEYVTRSVRFAPTATSLSKIYDGDESNWDWLKPGTTGSDTTIGVSMTSGALRAGDHFVVTGTANSPLESFTAGTYNGSYQVHILDSFDNPADAYYDFNGTQTGNITLSIQKRALSIGIVGYTGVYDGLDHPSEEFLSGEGYNVTSGSLGIRDSLDGAPGSKYHITTSAVSYTGTFTVYHQKLDSSIIDVTSSYSIAKTNGSISISKRSLTLDFGSNSKDFDDAEVTLPDLKDLLSEDPDLALGDELNLSLNRTIRDPGTYSLSSALTATVTRGGVSRSDCYNITVSGSYTINKRQISYHVGDVTRMYSSTLVDISPAEVTHTGSFLPGDHLEAYYSGNPSAITSASTYANVINARVVDSLGQDRSAYYTLTVDNVGLGDYTVTKAPISFDLTNTNTDLIRGEFDVANPGVLNVVGAIGNDAVVISQITSAARPDKAGIYNWNEWLTIEIRDSMTNADHTNFYDIEVSGGGLRLENKAITVRVDNTVLEVGSDNFAPTYTILDDSGLQAGHSIKVEFQNVNSLKYELLTDYAFAYTIKVVDVNDNDVSAQYDISDSSASPTLTTIFPNVSYRINPREYTYEGHIADKASRTIKRDVTLTGGRMPETYSISWSFFLDGSYDFVVTHNSVDVTAQVRSKIAVDNSNVPVEKPRQGFASIGAKQIQTNTTTVALPYSASDISITNLPLAAGDSIASASFLYNGSSVINITDDGSGEMQIFTFTVELVSINITNAYGDANYSIDIAGARATLTIVYIPL